MAEEATTDVVDAPVADAPVADPIMDILTEDESESPKESSPKPKEPEVAEGKEGDSETPAPPDVPIKDTDSEKEADADDTAETPVAEETAQPQGKAEERKTQLNTEIRDLVAQRNALKTEVEKINGEVYQPATEDELVASGLSQTDAKLEALSQRLEVQDYNNRVTEAQLTIESESQRVLNDFPIFRKFVPGTEYTDPTTGEEKGEPNPEYRQNIANEAAALLNDSLEYDQNTGQIVGSKISPYRLYKTLAASHNVAAQAGQLKGQQDTEKMLARADDAGSAAPKVEKKDPIMDILLSDDY